MSSVPPLTQWLDLDWMLVVVGAWLLVGVAGVLALHRFALVSHVLFPIGGLLGLALFGLALHAVFGTPKVVETVKWFRDTLGLICSDDIYAEKNGSKPGSSWTISNRDSSFTDSVESLRNYIGDTKVKFFEEY